jgi:hypothetical protein
MQQGNPMIIATRKFAMTYQDGSEQFAYLDISLPLELPNPDPEMTDWQCQVITRGLGADKSYPVIGADAVQAIYNALILAGALVSSSLVALASDIDWGELPNFGFPPNPSASDNGPLEPIPDPNFSP